VRGAWRFHYRPGWLLVAGFWLLVTDFSSWSMICSGFRTKGGQAADLTSLHLRKTGSRFVVLFGKPNTQSLRTEDTNSS
jgi:hypothetical protein